MQVTSFSQGAIFNDEKVSIKVILESSFSKEIRIMFKQGQVMKEHTAPYPIVVHVLDGEIDFGISGDIHNLKKGGVITLQGNVPHDLKAKEDSIVRLSLSKLDTSERVASVANS